MPASWDAATRIGAVLQATQLWACKAPERALRLLQSARRLFEEHADESSRVQRFRSEISLMLVVFSSASFSEPLDVTRSEEELRRRAREERWDSERLGLAFFKLSSLSPSSNQEDAGLKLLNEALTPATTFAACQKPFCLQEFELSSVRSGRSARIALENSFRIFTST
jgi:hypothetical protein